ncbi:MAG: conjugal transfer protein TraF [Nitrospirota bacterium]
MIRNRNAVVMLLFAALVTILWSGVGRGEENFFGLNEKKGWFWYEDPPDPPKPEHQDVTPDVSVTVLKKPKALTWEELKRISLETVDLDTLPARWLRAIADAKREYALDDPIPERVKDYIVVQRAVFARSERFTSSWQVVMYANPDLDYSSQHPTSEFGHQVEADLVAAREEEQLRKIAERGGLFFFFTSTCKFCQEQAKTLRVFADTYGFSVLPISLDGKALPEFPNVNVDNGIAKRLEVKMVPTLYLAIPDERVLTPIGAGVLTVSDLKERILRMAGVPPAKGLDPATSSEPVPTTAAVIAPRPGRSAN